MCLLSLDEIDQALGSMMRVTKLKRTLVIPNNLMKEIDFTRKKFPVAIVQNVANSGSKPTHWVCYYMINVCEKIYWYFFDSLGREPEVYNLILPPGTRSVSNVFELVIGSRLSGQFCLFFLHLCAIDAFPKILETYNKCSRYDKVVKKYYNHLMFNLDYVYYYLKYDMLIKAH